MNNRDYSDIIDHPHHQSKTRPHMSLHDRAAQFSPFAALVGYDAAVDEAGRLTDRQITLDEDALTRLDEALRHLTAKASEHPAIRIDYFVKDDKKEGGIYVEITGRLKRIDSVNRNLLLMDGKEIPLSDIIDIEMPDSPQPFL